MSNYTYTTTELLYRGHYIRLRGGEWGIYDSDSAGPIDTADDCDEAMRIVDEVLDG